MIFVDAKICLLIICLLVASADNLCNSFDPDQTVPSKFRADLNPTVWQSEGIPEIFFKKMISKKSADDNNIQIPSR